jgi:cell shape-determining protein MreC
MKIVFCILMVSAVHFSAFAEGYQSFEEGAKPVYERISKLREQIKLNEMQLSNQSSTELESEKALVLKCIEQYKTEIKQLEESLDRTKALNELPFVHFFDSQKMTECYLKPKV